MNNNRNETSLHIDVDVHSFSVSNKEPVINEIIAIFYFKNVEDKLYEMMESDLRTNEKLTILGQSNFLWFSSTVTGMRGFSFKILEDNFVNDIKIRSSFFEIFNIIKLYLGENVYSRSICKTLLLLEVNKKQEKSKIFKVIKDHLFKTLTEEQRLLYQINYKL